MEYGDLYSAVVIAMRMQEFVIVQPSYPGNRVWAIAVLPFFWENVGLLGAHADAPTPVGKNLICGARPCQYDGHFSHDCH